MKIEMGNDSGPLDLASVSIGLLCTKKELDELIEMLLKFQFQIDQYLDKNKNKSNLGFTHIHYQDNSEVWKKGDADIVFYVDLDKQ